METEREREGEGGGRSCVGMWQIGELPARREPINEEVEAPPRRTRSGEMTSGKDETL